ncbi:unnamed protein product [Prorocentrum cordatum]|uniref:Uncharacterized protein n=1 Tax=Prorocentrum cordatum TaxID=2364126 RepID=A0ABN9XKJ9_9DINO|nr:unnamed protein product [Polarella glacialis]
MGSWPRGREPKVFYVSHGPAGILATRSQEGKMLVWCSLPDDDLTVAASGFSEEALLAVANGTDFFVNMFERCLKLKVSTTKSFAIASRPSLATKLACLTKPRLLVPKRGVKLLGTSFAAGRTRGIGVLQCRLKELGRRIPKVHALRRQRLDVTRVVKTIGSPSMLYGIDIVGVSNTHLHRVRVAARCAALPLGASRQVDFGFAVLDARGAALDPAYAAHGTPLRH